MSIRALQNVKTEDVVFIDIETVSSVKELEVGTQLYDAWAYKARYQNEINRKTGKEYTLEEYFEEKAALYAPFAKIVCITVGRIIEKSMKVVVKSYYGDDEAELLTRFNDDLTSVSSKNPNTVLCGLNNIGFDEPFIFKRMLINQIKPTTLIDSSGLKPWEVKSIDLGKLFQGSSFYPDSLLAIATALGLPSPKDGIDGSMVTEVYYKGGLDKIVKYCELDVFTTANIFRKMRFEETIDISNLEIKTSKERELPAPVLQRLYMSKDFNKNVREEISTLIGKNELDEKEKTHLKDIILSVYIDKSDKVADKKVKTQEIEEYVNSL